MNERIESLDYRLVTANFIGQKHTIKNIYTFASTTVGTLFKIARVCIINSKVYIIRHGLI